MKKATVLVQTGEHLRPDGEEMLLLNGWQTNTPGLVLAKFNPGDKQKHERWYLWHAHTGTFIHRWETRKAGEALADALGSLDWTGHVTDMHEALIVKAVTEQKENDASSNASPAEG